MIATLVGLQLFRSITRPLMGLEKEALSIKQHDLITNFNTCSIFKEINETAAAFSQMKDSLRTSEKNIASFLKIFKTSILNATLKVKF